MPVPVVEIENLRLSHRTGRSGSATEVLCGVSLTIEPGEVHALVGPPGAGGSVLATALLGSPDHDVAGGRIRFRGDDITDWSTDVRAKAGLFLAFPQPPEITGVTVLHLVRQALAARAGTDTGVRELRRSLLAWMAQLDIDPGILEPRGDEGFSPGEQRSIEILQVAALEPHLVVLDATGWLDLDGLATLAAGIRTVRADRPALGTLAITDCRRALEHLQPDHVHVVADGRIVATGGPELARRLETEGYESFT